MKSQKSSQILVLLIISTLKQTEVATAAVANQDSTTQNVGLPAQPILSDEFKTAIELLGSRVSLLAEEVAILKKIDWCFQCTSPNYQDDNKSELAKTMKPTPLLVKSPLASHQYGRRSTLIHRSVADEGRQASFFRGEPGRNGLDGVPGLDGAPGLDGVPGADGRDGKDGINGHDGKDGRDGLPGERGPIGPPGPSGEMGRRGKQGPPGKTGAPGQPGVCAYKAKYDCSLISSSSNTIGTNNYSGSSKGSSGSGNQPIQALLMAPTMIGQEYSIESLSGDSERQVTVKEGDYIQLSCEAVGLPKPGYAWRRPDRSSTILLDPTTDFKVTSFPGSQLPFVKVDRLQTGSYECIASNGVPPAATKKINLDVNYAPTIRLYPGPSVYRVPFGSSILIECIVDASPSSFSYWMFGSDLIMSIAPPSPSRQSSITELSQPMNKHNKKHIITESTGQLLNGAYYSILTLNITNIGHNDLGLYKCISKNLIGQSTGYAWLESLEDSSEIDLSDRKFRQTILEKSSIHERLDRTVGWPSYLTEREANYSTFGNEHRHQQQLNISAPHRRVPAIGDGYRNISLLESLIYNLDEASATTTTTQAIINNNKGESKADQSSSNAIASLKQAQQQQQYANESDTKQTEPTATLTNADDADEAEPCRIEKGDQLKQQSKSRQSSNLLLDQVGKPVYIGSVASGSMNWWSLDSKLNDENITLSAPTTEYYATFSNISDQLFEYSSLIELLKDQQQSIPTQTAKQSQETKLSHKLSYPMFGSSRLIHDKIFIYASSQVSSYKDDKFKPEGLGTLQIIEQNLKTGQRAYLKMDGRILRDIDSQPLDLGSDYKLDRIEFASDENGVWLILPTIESKFEGTSDQNRLTIMAKMRRLHVLKLKLATPGQASGASIEVDYHVSMKLDWRMIGQMFIIDGVLYGIKDRHLYSSKLQFAYDLYKCKLLSTEYLNEPQRTFTNHFGNTQMIKYNPNEPKRLYTIDNGNLLWCPVKLTKVNRNDTLRQQKQDNIQ